MSEMERYGAGKIVIAEYDPVWRALFEQEQARVSGVLGSMVIAIQHVGSTAVPGLAAKPIIDLLITVRSLERARLSCIEPLGRLGYAYLREYEAWLPDEMVFRKGPPGPWTHHLHLMEPSSPRREEFILIRDYLRRHLEVAGAYAELKRELARRLREDIAGYREGKRPFLQTVLAQARAEGEHTAAGRREECPS